jgi:hypothetical protein
MHCNPGRVGWVERCNAATNPDRSADSAPGQLQRDTGDGLAFQMEAADSAMVRPLENLPDPATFKMASSPVVPLAHPPASDST